MKKGILILFVMLTTGMVAQAQVSLGLKVGASSSTVDVNNLKNNLYQFKDEGSITGYHAGAFVRLKAAGFTVQPEAYFSTTGGKLERKEISSNNVEEIRARFNRLDVPVLVGFSLLNLVRIQAGPVASVLMNGKLGEERIENYLDKTDWGFQAGVGIDISSFSADLRYERVNREYTNQSTSYDIGNQQVLVSLGYKLFGK
ncbi:porin family protein [Adhaeribacter aquaticus]|uniref:porin family protein n=1 Tax=Adhaeribacter aquaticus TaxID=299567 RepID=UPI00047C31A1|nr:porin family protein [Adhaeribacter aquaticus]